MSSFSLLFSFFVDFFPFFNFFNFSCIFTFNLADGNAQGPNTVDASALSFEFFARQTQVFKLRWLAYKFIFREKT